jgi:PAS domain S-box-containing protein
LGRAGLQRRCLEEEGYNVLIARSLEESLQRLGKDPIEVAVLDFQQPGNTTGLEGFAQIRGAGHVVPVILATSLSDKQELARAHQAGIRDFMPRSGECLGYLPEVVGRVLRQARTEDQLVQVQARLASIVNSAMDAILTVDDQLRITLFNTMAETVFRCPAVMAIGRPVGDFILLDSGSGTDLFARTENNAHLCATWFELKGVRSDAEPFPLEASISYAQGRGQHFHIVIVRDITERRRAEQRVREQAALLDNATDAILVRDMDDRIQFWNRGAQRLFGWAEGEVLGQDANQLLFRAIAPSLQEALATVLAKGEWNGELAHRTRNGREVVVESRWTLLLDAEGRPKSKLVINTDVTEKKRFQAQALRTQRLESIGILAGGIAHDLNNVLTPILLAVELLKPRLTDPGSQTIVNSLQASAQLGAEMVKQILAFARGEEGQHVEMQLKHLLRDVEQTVQHTWPKSITIRSCVPRDLWLVSGNATQLHQVLMNLCSNARDAMPQGGILNLAAENICIQGPPANGTECPPLPARKAKPGPYVLCRISDTGVGIAPEFLDKVFDPFFTTKQRGKGTGLGLSTALGIVQTHGGFMNVWSKVNRGTEFSVFLPAAGAVLDNHAKENPDSLTPGYGAGAVKRMLLVNDAL